MSIISTIFPGINLIKFWFYIITITLIISVAGMAFWHYNNVISELSLEKAKNETLQNAIITQNATIDAAKDSIAQWQMAQKQFSNSVTALNKSNAQAQQYLRRLSEIYAKHDLEQLSLKHPTDAELRINDGTKRAIRLLKCASGSGDTDCGDESTNAGKDFPSTKPRRNSDFSNTLGNHH